MLLLSAYQPLKTHLLLATLHPTPRREASSLALRQQVAALQGQLGKVTGEADAREAHQVGAERQGEDTGRGGEREDKGDTRVTSGRWGNGFGGEGHQLGAGGGGWGRGLRQDMGAGGAGAGRGRTAGGAKTGTGMRAGWGRCILSILIDKAVQ